MGRADKWGNSFRVIHLLDDILPEESILLPDVGLKYSQLSRTKVQG